jgi:gamma-glutamylcyclotransferase (GGCT)/AIG2-like uncharacterized protein YtfP
MSSVVIPPAATKISPGSLSDKLAFFVYGTLMQGQANTHRWLNSVVSESTATIANARLHTFPTFPMMLIDLSGALADQRVHGSVVWIDATRAAEVLQCLDALEEFFVDEPEKSVYLRVRVTATVDETGETVECFTYCARSEEQVRNLPLVENNDWGALANANPAINEWWKQQRSGADVRDVAASAPQL